MEEGLLAVDHQGTVLLANESLCRGFALRGPVGRHYLEAVRQREVAALVEEVLRTGQRRDAEVSVHYRHRVYALVGGPFPGMEGAPHGALVTFHDITDRRRVDQIRRDFIANASHELRTPLTSIRGYVEALEDGALAEPENAQRFLAKIRFHSERMAALVGDLLELSRLESGERAPRTERVASMDIVADVVASLADLAASSGVALSARDDGALDVVTDGDRLRRILENLVENGIKYTQPGGKVEVIAGSHDGAGLIAVQDDGPGIPAEHLPRIFERFYRVDKARSRAVGGTGLGLSIVRHLAESIGATVTVSSEPGRGSRFVVTIPSRPA